MLAKYDPFREIDGEYMAVMMIEPAELPGRPGWIGGIVEENLLKRIEMNPGVMLGKPVIAGTRITVEILLEKLAADIPIDGILEDYPDLTRVDVLAALAYARQAISTEDVLPSLAVHV